jgi:hypothetical protein
MGINYRIVVEVNGVKWFKMGGFILKLLWVSGPHAMLRCPNIFSAMFL